MPTAPSPTTTTAVEEPAPAPAPVPAPVVDSESEQEGSEPESESQSELGSEPGVNDIPAVDSSTRSTVSLVLVGSLFTLMVTYYL